MWRRAANQAISSATSGCPSGWISQRQVSAQCPSPWSSAHILTQDLVGVVSIAKLHVECVEELALQIFGHHGRAGGRPWEFIEEAETFRGLWLVGQGVQLFWLRLACRGLSYDQEHPAAQQVVPSAMPARKPACWSAAADNAGCSAFAPRRELNRSMSSEGRAPSRGAARHVRRPGRSRRRRRP